MERVNKITITNILHFLQEIEQFKSTTIDAAVYMEWIDKYQAQLVVLAAQISWSETVESALQVYTVCSP